MKKKKKDKLFIKLAIILPILSILIGYFGVKLFFFGSDNNIEEETNEQPSQVEEEYEEENNDQEVEENNQNQEEENENEEDKERTELFSFKRLSFYSIQMGSFSDEENALSFNKELREKGLASYVLKSGDHTRVYAYVKLIEDRLAKYIPKTAQIIDESFIKSITIQPESFTYKLKDREHIQVIEEVDSILANNFANLARNPSQEQIDKAIEEINVGLKKINSIEFSDSKLKQIDTKLTNLLKNSKSVLSAIDEENSDLGIQNYLSEYIEFYVNIK